jgi:molybdopterin biosynthesis enzyme
VKRIPPFDLAEVAGYALRFPDALRPGNSD